MAIVASACCFGGAAVPAEVVAVENINQSKTPGDWLRGCGEARLRPCQLAPRFGVARAWRRLGWKRALHCFLAQQPHSAGALPEGGTGQTRTGP